MAEEIKTEEATAEVDYVQAIQDLKANTVPKDQYAKLKEENQKLLKAMINGEEIAADVVSNEPTIADLRKELYGGEGFSGSDLEGWKKTLALREKLIEEEGYDPFVPHGRQVAPTASDYEVADRVAAVVSDCIEYANGDNKLFVSELSRRTTGTAIDRVNRK